MGKWWSNNHVTPRIPGSHPPRPGPLHLYWLTLWSWRWTTYEEVNNSCGALGKKRGRRGPGGASPLDRIGGCKQPICKKYESKWISSPNFGVKSWLVNRNPYNLVVGCKQPTFNIGNRGCNGHVKTPSILGWWNIVMCIRSWWLNQPIWKKIRKSNWKSSSQINGGENSKKTLSCHHLAWIEVKTRSFPHTRWAPSPFVMNEVKLLIPRNGRK